jgi:CheY-like chemotaxis protein
MKTLRLLIVDDVEDNRLVLHAICRKMEGFDIQEACDGVEAIEKAAAWRPHIILMDIMMPRLDGFEASKVIKSRFPETIIMVVTAVIDPQMESHMASIGVAAYIHKPIDKELIRFKLQSIRAYLSSKEGDHTKLSTKEALNPFCPDVRSYKTIFSITDAEGMMDFGVWVLARCKECDARSCSKVDAMIELFYDLMRQGIRERGEAAIIIEESFEEVFITMKLETPVLLKPQSMEVAQDLQNDCIIRENIACVRLKLIGAPHKESESMVCAIPVVSEAPAAASAKIPETPPVVEPVKAAEPVNPPEQAAKEVRSIDAQEQTLLRQSFVDKTSAADYVAEIGGDVLDEIRDLESLDEEWRECLALLEAEPTIANVRAFTDDVLGVYVRAINGLFEFTALAYALSSLGSFMKEHAETILSDPSKLKTLVMLTEYLGSDLTSWREHIFALQDAADIHYLDSSFFSSCMQIEQIIGNKEVQTDDDNDMEFF